MSIQFEPLDVPGMSNEAIGAELREMGEDFPFTGNNYAIEILEEAVKRLKVLEQQSNE